MSWQAKAAHVALQFFKPLVMTFAVQFIGGLFAAARNHFDGEENPDAKVSVEGYMSPDELRAVQEVLHLLQNRTVEHIATAIDTGEVPDFDLSAPGGTSA